MMTVRSGPALARPARRRLLNKQRRERDQEEEERQEDGRAKQNFINATFSAEHVARTTEYRAKPGTLLLK